MSFEIKGLRCVNCGAPLPLTKAEFITCEFCGFSQKVIDANEYFESIKNEIYEWLKNLVPATSIATTATLDPVARHNLFIYNVKPAITGDYISTRNKLLILLTTPLITLPFMPYVPRIDLKESPKDAFKNASKIDGLTALAVVDDDLKYIKEVQITYNSYAYILNALMLLKKGKDSDKIEKNLESAAYTFSESAERQAEHLRLSGLVKALRGIRILPNGDIANAERLLTEALMDIEKAKNLATINPSSSPMLPAIDEEITILRTMKNLVEVVSNYVAAGYDLNMVLTKLERYHNFIKNSLDIICPGEKQITKRCLELSEYLKEIAKAKCGDGTIKILPGQGNIYVPFWSVEITYTFTTGVWFAKKGKVCVEKILVSATIPYSGIDTLTDIFKLRAPSTLWQRISGKEGSLTLGVVTRMLQQARETTIQPTTKVVPPVNVKTDVEKIADNYINKVSAQLKGKIKFGSSKAIQLVYTPGQYSETRIIIPTLKEFQIKLDNVKLFENLSF